MKVIFLDIDGVLNSGKWVKHLAGGFDDPINQMDPAAVMRLNAITDATGAVIVVSSTWRLAFLKQANALCMLQRCMRAYKLTGEVIGMTGVASGTNKTRRGNEIQGWLDQNTIAIEKFVIIDVDSDMGHLIQHRVLTKFETGLQDEHVETIIGILGKK
jgi:hypothetical protein